MDLAKLKAFFDGTKTGSGLTIATFTPMITSLLVSNGWTTGDAANTVNAASALIGGAITIWGIVDRKVRAAKKTEAKQA